MFKGEVVIIRIVLLLFTNQSPYRIASYAYCIIVEKNWVEEKRARDSNSLEETAGMGKRRPQLSSWDNNGLNSVGQV